MYDVIIKMFHLKFIFIIFYYIIKGVGEFFTMFN